MKHLDNNVLSRVISQKLETGLPEWQYEELHESGPQWSNHSSENYFKKKEKEKEKSLKVVGNCPKEIQQIKNISSLKSIKS